MKMKKRCAIAVLKRIKEKWFYESSVIIFYLTKIFDMDIKLKCGM